MQTPAVQQRLTTYQQWKTRVARAVAELGSWLEEHRRATPRAREQLRAALDVLAGDYLTVAFVAESSCGKTELINAIFFSDLAGGLLPCVAGRTCRCPIELLWDAERNEASLRLLPAETRAQDALTAQFKSNSQQWVHYPLNLQGAEQIAGTLKEILQTKQVSMAEAARLGLSSTGLTPEGQPTTETVKVLKWRHAIVSFPHRLLKQGLVILDTPGVNALGNEPELTISMLPAAQAVLFVLSADVGVTCTDLEIWQYHLKGFQTGRQRAMLVALNQSDMRCDEPPGGADGAAATVAQRRNTALAVGINEEVVFPVAAAQALAAKGRVDDAMLRRSALPVLERHLATKMLETKHQFLIDAIDASVGQVLDCNRNRVASRITRVKSQLEELEQLRDKSQDVIARP